MFLTRSTEARMQAELQTKWHEWKSVEPRSGITSDQNPPVQVRCHRFGTMLPGPQLESPIRFDQKNVGSVELWCWERVDCEMNSLILEG
jgi:hypothetical protein